MKRHEGIIRTTLAVMAATLALGCGAEDGADGPADLGDEARPRIDTVEVTRLEVTGADRPAMLHPIDVELELDVEGEAFDTDVLVGLRADGGELGCVLGALPAKQAEAGATHLSLGAEFFVNADCRDMVGRDDVELFVAFDPWGGTEVDREGTTIEEPTGLYDIVRGSMLDLQDCAGCRTATELLDSPGIDAQLREVGLHSSVAVLRLPEAEDQVEMPSVETPHFEISSAARVTGLAKGQGPLEGEAFMTYRIRPQAGALGTDGLDDESLSWAPLWERRRDDDGMVHYADQVALDARGQVALQRASAVYIGEDVAARMGAGDWQGITEYELQVCVGTTVEQAVYDGETTPRDNDCAVLPVVVVHDRVGPHGERGVEDGEVLPGGAKARSAEVWGTGWSTTTTFLGTDYVSGLDFETWLDINASDSSSTTYGGNSVASAGSWFEAGVLSQATVFNNVLTILDASATLIGYDSGGGEIEVYVETFGDVLVNTYANTAQGIFVSLDDILSSNVETVFTEDVVLVGYEFDDGCGTVEAGIFLEGYVGIDRELTGLTVTQVGGGGVQIVGDIVPVAGVDAVSKASAGYSGFLSINVELAINLNIFEITFPFQATVTYQPGTPATLTFTESVSLGLSSLSGNITFSFDYEFWCPNPFTNWTCEDDHSHTLVSWDGISDNFPLFSWAQSFEFGTGASFCDNFDGTWIKLRTAHDRYVEGFVAPRPVQVADDSDFTRHLVQCSGEQVALRRWDGLYMFAPNTTYIDYAPMQMLMTPVAQSDGTWAFKTPANRYLKAAKANVNWEIRQQTYVGSWERFEVTPW